MLIRGGTSKSVFFLDKDLPQDLEERSKLLIRIMGSPDPREIDGLGGGDPLTSRTTVIKPSSKEGIDVEFHFGLVRPDVPKIEYHGFCGNIMCGTLLFAKEANLTTKDEITIYDVNTSHVAKVSLCQDNAPLLGVPNTGQKVLLTIKNPTGTYTKKLLPSKKEKDKIETDKKEYEVSYIDAIDPVVFVKARDFGLTAEEPYLELDQNLELLSELEKIRKKSAPIFNLDPSGSLPKVVMVGSSEKATLSVRMLALKKIHKAFAVSTSIPTAICSKIKGTVVDEVASKDHAEIFLAHPTGIMKVSIKAGLSNTKTEIEEVSVERTARILMQGHTFG